MIKKKSLISVFIPLFLVISFSHAKVRKVKTFSEPFVVKVGEQFIVPSDVHISPDTNFGEYFDDRSLFFPEFFSQKNTQTGKFVHDNDCISIISVEFDGNTTTKWKFKALKPGKMNIEFRMNNNHPLEILLCPCLSVIIEE